MAASENSCMVDSDSTALSSECVMIHPEVLVDDAADAESLAFTGISRPPYDVEDFGDLNMESQFVSTIKDLQDSLGSRTADSRLFYQEQFVDSEGNLNGYAEFPAEKIFPSQHDTLEVIAQTDEPIPDPNVNLALVEDSHTLGVNESRQCSSDAEVIMMDDVIYTTLPDSLRRTLQYGIGPNNEELVNAGQDYLMQPPNEVTSSEASGVPLPPEAKEWLKHHSLGLSQLNDDNMSLVIDSVNNENSSNENDSPLRFERSHSPPILCRLKHGKKTRVIHHEISDQEFDELLLFYGGPDTPSGCPLESTVTSDFDTNDHELSENDDEEYFCPKDAQDIQPHDDQSSRNSSALENHPNSSLLTSAVSHAGDIISSQDSREIAIKIQSTPDDTAITDSTVYTLPGSTNASFDVRSILLPSMPASMAVGNPPQVIHVPPPSPTDLRPDLVGTRQAKTYGEDSNSVVYIPGDEFTPVQVTPRKSRPEPSPKTTTPSMLMPYHGDRNSNRNVTTPAQTCIVTASISAPANSNNHQSLSSIPVFISDCASNSARFNGQSPGHTSSATKSIAAVTKAKTQQPLSSIPVFTSDRESRSNACNTHSPVHVSPLTTTMVTAADVTKQQPLSSIPVLVGRSPPDRDSSRFDENLVLTYTSEGHQSRNTSETQDLISDFNTPRKRTRRGRRATDGRRALARREYEGRGSMTHQSQSGGQNFMTTPYRSRQDNGQANSTNTFNSAHSASLHQHHWQQPLPTFSPLWSQHTASSSRAHMSHICPSSNKTTSNGTAMTPSAFFSPFPSYNPPTPTPFFRPAQNPPFAHSLSACPASAFPGHHLSQRRSASFLHPPHSPEISESPIPFNALQPSHSSTLSRRPREIATVHFHNSQTRDFCMEMFEKEKMKSEKGRQLMVTENMEGSNSLIVSGPVGANVRGFLQALFGPSIEIKVVLT